MQDDDLERVRALVEEHGDRTDSAVAARVLEQWDELARHGSRSCRCDYKRALRETAERRAVEAGEPALIGERGNADGSGPVEAGQPAPYPVADGHQEAAGVGEAGQHEDASVAAARAGEAARRAGAGPAEEEQIEEEATEEVLPSNG